MKRENIKFNLETSSESPQNEENNGEINNGKEAREEVKNQDEKGKEGGEKSKKDETENPSVEKNNEEREGYSKEQIEKLFDGRTSWLDEAEKINPKEARELLDFLNKVVFPYFHLTLGDELKARERYERKTEENSEIDPRVKQRIKEINIESFRNTRIALAEFFENTSIYGAVKVRELSKLLMRQESQNGLRAIKNGISELANNYDKNLNYGAVLENLTKRYTNKEYISQRTQNIVDNLKNAVALLNEKLAKDKEKNEVRNYWESLLEEQKKRESNKQYYIDDIKKDEEELKRLENKEQTKRMSSYERIKRQLLLEKDIKDLKKFSILRTDNGKSTIESNLREWGEKINEWLERLKEKDIFFGQLDEKIRDKSMSCQKIADLSDIIESGVRSFRTTLPSIFKYQEIINKSSADLSVLIENNLIRILGNPREVPGSTHLKQWVYQDGLYEALLSLFPPVGKARTVIEKIRNYEKEKDKGWKEKFQKNKEKYIKKFPKEIVWEELKHQYESVKEINYFCTNRDFEGTKTILEDGAILPTLDLVRLSKKYPERYAEARLKANAVTPQEISFGFPKRTPLVYGTFIGGRGAKKLEELKKGGAPGYGDVFFLIKPEKLENRIVFLKEEGRNWSEDNNHFFRNYTDFSLDHIPIIKAINDIKKAVPELRLIPVFYHEGRLDKVIYHGFGFTFRYLAAEVIDKINIEDVESINFRSPLPDQNLKEIEDLKKKYSKYKDKFRIIK